MRLGLVSDTHGETENLRSAARMLMRDWRVETVVHLGDECEDIAVLKDYPLKIIQVPGVYCEHYRNPAITNRLLMEFEGYRILFTHTPGPHKNDLPGDPDPAALAARGEVDIVAYGHTHVPEIRVEGTVLWVNPGHLKSSDKKGYPPGFAVLELGPDGPTCRIINLRSGAVSQST
ncbi:MAG: metallophosphoesterase family protein [Bacillota bacterium]